MYEIQQYGDVMSCMDTIVAILALCDGNQSVTDWIPSQRASNVKLRGFVWSYPESATEQAVDSVVISDAMKLM